MSDTIDDLTFDESMARVATELTTLAPTNSTNNLWLIARVFLHGFRLLDARLQQLEKTALRQTEPFAPRTRMAPSRTPSPVPAVQQVIIAAGYQLRDSIVEAATVFYEREGKQPSEIWITPQMEVLLQLHFTNEFPHDTVKIRRHHIVLGLKPHWDADEFKIA